MSLSLEKQHLLQAFLAGLPERYARPLANAVELDKVAGGAGLPHDVILEGLRPALARTADAAHAARPATPLRLFTALFEDLLVPPDRRVKLKGRIARSSLAPFWAWLGAGPLRGRLPVLEGRLRAAVLSGAAAQRDAVLSDIYALTGEAVAQEFQGRDSGAPDALAAAMGGQDAAMDVRDIGCICRGAPELAQLQRAVPRAAPHLSPELTETVREIFDRLNARARDAAGYVPVFVMPRLAKPWEVLRLAAQLARQDVDTLISATDMAMAGDILLAEMEELSDRLQALRPADLDAAAGVADLSRFARLSYGMVHEIGIKRDGRWGQRLMKARARVAEAMETLLERAPRDILAVLPTKQTKGLRRPDISRMPDADRAARAERLAHLLAGARPYAAAAAFQAALTAALDEVAQGLRAYDEDILRELRGAAGDARARAEAHLELALTLSEHVLGEQETSLLRRRARAA